jgi:hypothetical protein
MIAMPALAQPADISKSTVDPIVSKTPAAPTQAPVMQTHPSPTAQVNAERAARSGELPGAATGDATTVGGARPAAPAAVGTTPPGQAAPARNP